MASNLDDLPAWASELLREGRSAHLGLVDDRGHPRVLPVTYAVAAGAVVSAVDDKPKRAPGKELARVRYLRRRPQAALTVDRYDDDWARLAWVQVLGIVEIVDVGAEPAGLEELRRKYEAYRAQPPAGPLLRLVPGRVLHWRAAPD